MGCDIHCYIEYKNKDSDKDFWQYFGGRINPGRNYLLFSKLAGVRGGEDAAPKYPPRGMPNTPARESFSGNVMYISEEEGEGHIDKKTAERWVASECSRYQYNSLGNPVWVTNPDWHSHSWLLTHELEEVLGSVVPLEIVGVEYAAILAAMKAIESRGFTARLVFWFDN